MTLQSIQKSLAQEKGNREENDADVIYVNGSGLIDAAGVYHNGFDENENDEGEDGDDDAAAAAVAAGNVNADY